MSKPNFFIIGAPKSGTTSLCKYLSDHPNIFICNPKEPWFFASDFIFRPITNEKNYLKLFNNVDTGKHKVIGEGSTVYLFSKVAVSNILKFQPESKFIVMLRNPTDLVLSLHNQQIKSGNENILSFIDAWKAEPNRKAGKQIPFNNREPKLLYYSEWGKLGMQLNRLLSKVDKANVLIILFDDFVKDTLACYQETLSFLGLQFDSRYDFPVHNERADFKNVYYQKVFSLMQNIWVRIRSKFTLGKGLGMRDYIMRIIGTKAKIGCSSDIYNTLVDYYLDEIQLLEEITNKKLGHWKSYKQVN